MTHLNNGDKAPFFTASDHNGNEVSLSDYTGLKLALYFYPRDLTPTCTVQACNLRDHYEELKQHNISLVGVNDDDAKKHQKFIAKNDLPFPLLVDTEKEVLKTFGVWGPKKFMGREYDGIHRTTFIIDENGYVLDVITKVKTKEHTSQILI